MTDEKHSASSNPAQQLHAILDRANLAARGRENGPLLDVFTLVFEAGGPTLARKLAHIPVLADDVVHAAGDEFRVPMDRVCAGALLNLSDSWKNYWGQVDGANAQIHLQSAKRIIDHEAEPVDLWKIADVDALRGCLEDVLQKIRSATDLPDAPRHYSIQVLEALLRDLYDSDVVPATVVRDRAGGALRWLARSDAFVSAIQKSKTGKLLVGALLAIAGATGFDPGSVFDHVNPTPIVVRCIDAPAQPELTTGTPALNPAPLDRPEPSEEESS